MTATPEGSAPQGTEQTIHVELPRPSLQPEEELLARENQPGPDLDQRQAAIRTERRPAGPVEANRAGLDELEEEFPKENDVPSTDPTENSRE